MLTTIPNIDELNDEVIKYYEIKKTQLNFWKTLNQLFQIVLDRYTKRLQIYKENTYYYKDIIKQIEKIENLKSYINELIKELINKTNEQVINEAKEHVITKAKENAIIKAQIKKAEEEEAKYQALLLADRLRPVNSKEQYL